MTKPPKFFVRVRTRSSVVVEPAASVRRSRAIRQVSKLRELASGTVADVMLFVGHPDEGGRPVPLGR